MPGHRLHLVDLLPEGTPSPAARGYIELAAGSGGAGGFSLEQVELVAEPGAMEGVVNSVARGMIEDMCDVIRTYGCDILLLTGRPSRLPIIRDLILSNLPLTPDRVIGMDRYEVGGWYPFRSSSFRIPDPKSTAVVGAMLCQVCEGMARGFVFRASSLKMRSTARHLGIMDLNGQILDRSVLLRNADLDTGANMPDSFRLSLSGPTMIGFRQLPLERWKTSPLYFAYLNPSRLSDPKNPLENAAGGRCRASSPEAGGRRDGTRRLRDHRCCRCRRPLLSRRSGAPPPDHASRSGDGRWLLAGYRHPAHGGAEVVMTGDLLRTEGVALAARARCLCEVARDAIGWLHDTAGLVGTRMQALEHTCRRHAVEARRLAVPAERPMSVGVFGPSQAGKSFLVGSLITPSGGPAHAVFGEVPGQGGLISSRR